MKNLAGNKQADLYIQEELVLASIPLIRNQSTEGEVPHTILGKLDNWTFTRAWYYWMASVKEGNGLPLEIATQMHEREYPIIGENQPKTYGQVIRVEGNCGCPPPNKWALPNGETLRNEMKRLGKESANYGELAEMLNSGIMQGARFIRSYHIDTQLGLNELARVIICLR